MITVSNQDTERYLELNKDKNASEQVFNAAWKQYHNALNSIMETEHQMWEHLREVYQLDSDKEYIIKYSFLERRAVIQGSEEVEE